MPRKRPGHPPIRPMPAWTAPGFALRRRRRPGGLAMTLLAIALLAGAAWLAARLDPLPPPFSGMARASDGDSLRLRSDRIRLLGIDAPELDQTCWDREGAPWPCGRAARDGLVALLAGPVTCQPEGRDRYGRVLARCTSDGADVAARLVKEGLALATDGYGREQAEARAAGRGLWQGRFVDPRTWREDGASDDPGPSPLDTAWDWFRELTGARTLR